MPRFFYKDIVLEVPETVYFPRDDSLLLAEVLERQNAKTALDLGCGSGFLSILLAKKGADVTAIDINPAALQAAEKNAAINGVSVNVIRSDLFQNIKSTFDLIVFNPPYLSTEAPFDFQWSGGIDLIKKFLEDAKPHLADSGKILFVISTLTNEQKVIEAIERNNYKYSIIKRMKVPWEELVVFELKL